MLDSTPNYSNIIAVYNKKYNADTLSAIKGATKC